MDVRGGAFKNCELVDDVFIGISDRKAAFWNFFLKLADDPESAMNDLVDSMRYDGENYGHKK